MDAPNWHWVPFLNMLTKRVQSCFEHSAQSLNCSDRTLFQPMPYARPSRRSASRGTRKNSCASESTSSTCSPSITMPIQSDPSHAEAPIFTSAPKHLLSCYCMVHRYDEAINTLKNAKKVKSDSDLSGFIFHHRITLDRMPSLSALD